MISNSSCNCFFSSSIGKKVIVAVTGLLLLGFVIAHLVGNLQFFLGQEAINSYAVFLQDLGGLLWIARGGLLLAFILHVVFAICLTRQNNSARPVPYKKKNFVEANTASRYMIHFGMIILAFVIVHLLHFTFGILAEENYKLIDTQGRHDVYSMVVSGFMDIRYSAVYILAMLMLGAHLSHGIQSVFQTLGFYHQEYTAKIRALGLAVGWLIALGYMSIPLGVLTGIIKLPIEG